MINFLCKKTFGNAPGLDDKMNYPIRILERPEDMKLVEDLQLLIWKGGDLDVVPAHILLAIALNGGLVLGAYDAQSLVGFVFGFPGIEKKQDRLQVKHTSHELGVHPDYRNLGIGYALKRAQWQMVRHQYIEHITWTYDPLLSKNAYLNIARLGAVTNTYHREYYGLMRDQLNQGVPSDRFQVDWWVNTQRVESKLSRRVRRKLDLAHYLAADVPILNPSYLNTEDLPIPTEEKTPAMGQLLGKMESQIDLDPILLLEIPADFQVLRIQNLQLALKWRLHTRELFETAFAQGYLVTDFVYLPGATPRSFYVLSRGDITLNAI